MSGRRFIVRWSLRTLRREWRQHVVVVLFLVIGVAVSVVGALAVHHLVEPPESAYGDGDFAVTASNPDALELSLEREGAAFSRIDSATVKRDGTTERVTVKSLDPTSDVSAPLFVLTDGRWPRGAGEIVLTDRAFRDLSTIGSGLELGGVALSVVGIVEDPTALDDEFVVVDGLRQFPITVDVTTEFLVAGSPDSLDLRAGESVGVSTSGGPPARTTATLLVNVVAAFGMVEIGLLVGSTFAVLARRRARQYGLLASAGAAPSTLRAAAAWGGLVIGVIGAAIGLLIGLAVFALFLPAIESSVGHRVTAEFPLLAIGPGVALAIVVATVAARRPAVSLSRSSVVELLTSRRPRPEPTGRLAVVGLVIAAVGGALLVAGFTRVSTTLALLGTVLSPIGLLLVAPLVVAGIGRASKHLPLAQRMGGRTLARYNRRSAAVVAALALALSLPVGVVVVTSSIEARSATTGPNLEPGQFIVWADAADGHAPRTPSAVDSAGLDAAAETIAEVLPEAALVPIEVATPVDAFAEVFDDDVAEVPIVAAISPLDAECTFCDIDSWGFADAAGEERVFEARTAWIGSEALLDVLDIDDSWLADGRAAIIRDPGTLVAAYDGVLTDVQQVAVASTWPQNTTIPSVLYSPDLVAGDRFDVRTVGWLASSEAALSLDQSEAIRVGLSDGVGIEFHEPLRPRSNLRAIAMAIAVVVGIGLTVSAVALLIAETADEVALLESIGSPPAVSRKLSASIAAMLAVAGALLAIVIGYIPMLPMVFSKGDDFPFVVPWSALLVIGLGFPVLAMMVGRSMAGSTASDRALRQST